MKQTYIAVMDKLYVLCVWAAGISLVVLTTAIPFNVFMRYVMNIGMSWPEPLAIVFMIVFTPPPPPPPPFFAGAVCYRAGAHISVMLLVNAMKGWRRIAIAWVTELAMIAFNLFVLYYGIGLIQTTWHNFLAEFPIIRVGLTYIPLPVGAAITVLFIVERLWTRNYFPTSSATDTSAGLNS